MKTYTLSENQMIRLVDYKSTLNAFMHNPNPAQKAIDTAKQAADSLDNLVWEILEENKD